MRRIVWYGLAGVAILLGLYLSSRHSYLLFHSLVETFSVIVAVGIFIVAWHTRKLAHSSYRLLLGYAYLSVAVIEFAHMVSYKGMGVFGAATANLPTQLWIQARYVEALSLLLAPLLVRRRIRVSIPLLGYACATLCLLGITFATDLFPVCYVEGEGLTPFKKGSEYIICVILLFAAALHYLRRRDLGTGFFRLMLGSIVLNVMAELAFTRYFSVYGPANLVGHLLKVASFVLIYRAVVVTGLIRPQEALSESEANLRAFIDGTEDAICIRDLERRLILWNKAFADSIKANCGIDVCAGMRVEDYVAEEILAKFKPQRDRLYRTYKGKSQQAEFEFPCPDGKKRHFHTVWSPVRKEDEVVAVAEVTRDITEKKVAEHALEKSREESRALAGRLLSAHEEERRLLARELHDDLTQRLAVVAIELGTLEERLKSEEKPVSIRLGEIREKIVRLSGEVHSISRQIHPAILEDLGLVDAMKAEIALYSKREGIAVEFEHVKMPASIPRNAALVAYRVLQEGLRNIAKHAKVKQAEVLLRDTGDAIELCIKDSGAGFVPDKVHSKVGLASMKERARLVNGELSVSSVPGQGTVVNLKLPL